MPALLPGVGLCLAVTGSAYALEAGERALAGKAWLEALVLAILIGTAVRSLWTPDERWHEGIAFSAKYLLEVAVVLLGASVILSGVGFIGAGAVLRVGSGQEVHGLATAACIWVSATLGAAAGLAVWPLLVGGLLLAMLVLFVGAPLERRIRERARQTPAEADRRDAEQKP
ncbi:hypothetical protein Sbs19_39060 [Sphingobium sp. BS19]|nr:hypothetical protein Sbs19_39060 [Sphingobium sp. BS19]